DSSDSEFEELPRYAPRPGQRRRLSYSREFDSLLRHHFQRDLKEKFVTYRRLMHVLKKTPELVEEARRLHLTTENIRSRLRKLAFCYEEVIRKDAWV
ncbi:hypothetical protein PDJAM_G00259160, partial [Pangasius djambal]|nr:hypothetical protein [Pangasius djambal]